MKSNPILVALLLALALLLAACGPAAPSGSMPKEAGSAPAQEESMGSEKMDDEKMDDQAMKEGDSMEKDDSMAGDESMKDDEKMDSEKMDSEKMDSEKMDDQAMKEGDSMEKDDSMAGDESMKDDDKMDGEKMDSEAMMGMELSLSLNGLPDLGPGWAYEGWLIIDGMPVSTGVFTVDGDGMASMAAFPVSEHAAKATAFVLTIEPAPDPDPAPSATHILAGDLADGSASLSVAHPAALGSDFSSAGGTYILGIPTSDSPQDSYRSGIWFNGLTLPTLPPGWVYEGWVVGPDGPVSTGRFTDLQAQDSDGAGPTGGPKPSPALVGQDFLNPPVDLTSGYAAVISIEPEPDNSPAPFALKPLVDPQIDDVGDHVPQEMSNQAASFPTGMATLAAPMK